MTNNEVAEILLEIGTLLELKGENPFKTRAYQNAARTLEGLAEPLATIIATLGGPGATHRAAKAVLRLVETAATN